MPDDRGRLMLDYAAALATLVEDLTTAGISAGIDPGDVNPPGVLVRADAILAVPPKLCWMGQLRVSLMLVVPDTLPTVAYGELTALHGRVTPVLRPAGVTLTTDDQPFERLVLPDDPTGLPAIRLTAIVPVTAETTDPAPLPAPLMESEPAT